MRYAFLKKEHLNKWISFLKDKAKLYAPKKKETSFVFRQIKDSTAPAGWQEEICLDYTTTILPPKKYYFPQKEKLLHFNALDFKAEKSFEKFEEYIIFGVHTCDIAGIQCMDVVFRETPADPYYLNRKEKMTIIGIECLKYCDENATCSAMGNHVPRGGYDLMMIDVGPAYILHVNSDKGENLVIGLPYIKEAGKKEMQLLALARKEKNTIFKEELKAPLEKIYQAFDKSFNSFVWKDVGRRCVGCGNCTAVCPTCYCFDVVDEVDLTLNNGTRYRIWNSCQMDDFAVVAGGENFRNGTDSRQRHRYYRKFKYPIDKFNRYFCTGCGRCTRSCMAGIKLKETVNSIVESASM